MERVVKKVESVWRRVETVPISGYRREDAWKPRFKANFSKSKRDAASARMFFAEGIQKADISISKIAAINL
jgi:hypothetical protein